MGLSECTTKYDNMRTSKQKHQRILALGLIITALVTLVICGCSEKSGSLPNFVIIFTDDQGYNDLGCFGGTHLRTPRIDQMAEEGIRLTSFYVAQPLCSPSRAALMTGSYPKRIGLARGSRFIVLLSDDDWGLNPSEITIAEMLKSKDYATGIFGKWHLGDQPEFMPTRQGFDEFFGLPYSHNVHTNHPRQEYFQFSSLPLIDGESIIEYDPDADYLTQRITKRAISFIDQHRDEPFFLYIPHPMPHDPLHASPAFMETVADSIKLKLEKENGSIDYLTRNQLYPQVIEEIDWSVGEILDALERNGLDNNTLVIFTSDNGPYAGSAAPLRGKKGGTYEGGMRVPAVVRWPGKIPGGQVCDEMMTAMDIFPTLAFLTGIEVPDDRVIDGKNIWPLLSGVDGAKTPHEKFFYHRQNELKAVRSGKWKLHRSGANGLELYDLENDISEKTNLAKDHPQVVKRLLDYMGEFDREMSNPELTRPPGKVER
jgi:arylsulfatase A